MTHIYRVWYCYQRPINYEAYIICGPEMPLEHQAALKLKAAVYP
ncbi:MAG: hypothetical protein RMZ95_015660 [Nostoc sp. DedQUE07]